MENKKISKKLFLVILVSFSLFILITGCEEPEPGPEPEPGLTPSTDPGPPPPITPEPGPEPGLTPSTDPGPPPPTYPGPTPPPTHFECINECCIKVSGAGPNQCNSDSDCIIKCTDSDGGKNYFEKGTTSGRTWVDDDTPTSRTDFCAALTGSYAELSQCSGDNCGVYEFECVTAYDKPFVDGNIQPCEYGCKDGACICDMINTLADGELKTYTIGGIDYDVKPIITTNIYPYHVQFMVNGELTELLGTGNAFTLSNGAGIAVIEILPNEAGDVTQDLVEFCLNGKTSDEKTETVKIDGRYLILNGNFPDDVYASPIAFYTGVLPIGKIVRTLINFDLSGLENKEIKKAELVINKIPMLYGEKYGRQVTEVHKVMEKWYFHSASWNNLPSFDTTVVSSREITENGMYAFDITSIMDYLIEHEAGVLLKAENEEETNLKKFDEAYLNIWYTAEEETKSCKEMGGNCRFLFGCRGGEIEADYECPFWGKCCMPEEEENQEYVDLSDYPFPFIRDNEADFILIIGKDSSSDDVIAATDILLSLSYSSVEQIDVPSPVLDSEVDDIYSQNTIIIGNPCVNNAAAELLGVTSEGPECTDGFEEGKARIKLFQGLEGQEENVILLVAGYDNLRTRMAAKVLQNYNEYDLYGEEVIVSGESLEDINIQ